ncbi:MAG: carboxylating nicotinate-nucleotide diphosphorylase [Planctomycetes bacterium]|nr:carboxylating nicotinate-nucleotide diphosphorylase [Planctomycetota bacterium]
MAPLSLEIELVESFLEAALAEDVGPGDITSSAVIPPKAVASGAFVAREPGVLAGGPLLAPLFRKLAPPGRGAGPGPRASEGTPRLQVKLLKDDGDALARGDVIATIRGPARAILAGERVALNLLQRLSGIASMTRRFVEKAALHGAKVLDTRKTTPGLRYLEKYAVRAGGGTNHRMGLYDQVLIKDNHLLVAERRWPGRAVAGAIEAARAAAPGGIRIEVEADTLEQVRQAIEAGADIILLDNMTDAQMRQAVALARGRTPRPILEASGGVTEARVEAIAATGVDWISVGALTHSAPALDIALDLEPPE